MWLKWTNIKTFWTPFKLVFSIGLPETEINTRYKINLDQRIAFSSGLTLSCNIEPQVNNIITFPVFPLKKRTLDEYREQLISENVRKYQDVSVRLHNGEVSYLTLSKYQTLSLACSLTFFVCQKPLCTVSYKNETFEYCHR